MEDFTHFDDQGRARMVDVGIKDITKRVARARGKVYMNPETLELIKTGGIKKGNVLAVAQVAGIMAAKRTFELIPMCHSLLLTGIDLDFRYDDQRFAVEIEAQISCQGKTGVEMEALTAVSTAALTIYDMCKAVDRKMIIGEIRLVEKSGGKSGQFRREGEKDWERGDHS
ncbi:MAG: cyclic pyranopterin monophosphate synthase MoaC [Syntrophaceticus sp.]|jgi:cyclic pyranopterin phosphate synthase|nr:cyclic pyranopterin monophosphate synthase MoaC [Syntrophaceticus sp.]MDD3314649.1 cyclic pyranopterin monophosphate synthase MoaC [Syntrophaceticus sp.]MDD4360118.1 cyclic pyranopterin monophosphate synthase MoaC [Syntrophaceticus sp.]MDD4783162.1 cyclic pyranopterin monophosphate synthase MoaC [Syntrophaceticus sp.]